MKKISNQKGITLIALIITIIVMLILVAVTINVAMNGGLFGKAKTAHDDTQKEIDKEELLSATVAAFNEKTSTINRGILVDALSTGWDVSDGNPPYTCTSPTNNKFKVYANGTIENYQAISLTNEFYNSLTKKTIYTAVDGDDFIIADGNEVMTYKYEIYNGYIIPEPYLELYKPLNGGYKIEDILDANNEVINRKMYCYMNNVKLSVSFLNEEGLVKGGLEGRYVSDTDSVVFILENDGDAVIDYNGEYATKYWMNQEGTEVYLIDNRNANYEQTMVFQYDSIENELTFRGIDIYYLQNL